MNRQSSIRDKLKSSICCFSGTVHHDGGNNSYYDKLSMPRTPNTPTPNSPGSWLKKSLHSPQNDFGVRARKRGRRSSASSDFSYDPSSYALNFEDDSRADGDEFPFKNFHSRLPASAPTPTSSPSMRYSEELAVAVPTVHQRDCWI